MKLSASTLSRSLLFLLMSSIFCLILTALTAGLSGLLQLVGDSVSGLVFGWIAAVLGLLFFAFFLTFLFLFAGSSLFGGILDDSNVSANPEPENAASSSVSGTPKEESVSSANTFSSEE